MSEERGQVSQERGAEGIAMSAEVARWLAVPFQEIQGTMAGGGGVGGTRPLLPLRPSSTGIFDSLLLCETSRCPAPIAGMTLPEQALNSCCTQLQPHQAWRHSESTHVHSKK